MCEVLSSNPQHRKKDERKEKLSLYFEMIKQVVIYDGCYEYRYLNLREIPKEYAENYQALLLDEEF